MADRRSEAFALLGVPEGSDRSTVTRAYRRLARSTHPDVSTAGDSADRFAALSAAFAEASRPPAAEESTTPRTYATPPRRRRSTVGAGAVRPPLVAGPVVVLRSYPPAGGRSGRRG